MVKFRMVDRRHPEVISNNDDWLKWRLTYEGGRPFIDAYLKKFSKRENTTDFDLRKQVTYNPAFSKAAVNDFKNAIYQRMSEIKRLDGPKTYQDAVNGKEGGVDKYGMSMNTFIGQKILPELLSMGRVGIMVDKEPPRGPLLSNTKNNRPYLYYYCAEDIWNWNFNVGMNGEFYCYNLLLRIDEYTYDDKTGLPIGEAQIFRHFWINKDGRVQVDDYTFNKEKEEDVIETTRYMNLTRIPFVMPALTSSLMRDIADIQIALLNIASSDVNYILKGNTPFYTEQYDQASANIYGKFGGNSSPILRADGSTKTATNVSTPNAGTIEAALTSLQEEIAVGGTSGRRYAKGTERPGFIAPPAEPLLASMEKQKQLKEEIRQLVNLGIANVKSQHASAESKGMDDRSMEAGLSSIGQELQWAENEIAKIWVLYEKSEPAVVNYPEKYDLKSDSDREDSAKSLKELKNAVPSKTFAKEIGKQMAHTLLSGKISNKVMEKIDQEVDAANYITSDAKEIQIDLEGGIVGPTTASTARGYDGESEVKAAEDYQQKRLEKIAISQAKGGGAARGLPDKTKGGGKLEKKNSQDPALNPTGGGSLTRGAGG
jgi:hypothetical protein